MNFTKIRKLIHLTDEEFVDDWEITLQGGFVKFALMHYGITVVVFLVVGIRCKLNNELLFGYEYNVIVVALIYGFILATMLSVMNWYLYNARYRKLKKRNK